MIKQGVNKIYFDFFIDQTYNIFAKTVNQQKRIIFDRDNILEEIYIEFVVEKHKMRNQTYDNFLILKLRYFDLAIIFKQQVTQNMSRKQQKTKTNQTQINVRTQKSLFRDQDLQQASNNKYNKMEQTSRLSPLQFLKDLFSIYSIGDKKDKCLMIFGIILAMGSGVIFPLFMYVWGLQVNHIVVDYLVLDKTLDTSRNYYLAFLALGVFALLINGLVFALWKLLSETIGKKIRIRYLQNFIKRKMKWHQNQNLFEISSSFQSNCLTIEKATGDKVALFYNLIGIAVSGPILALCVRWTYALYLFALVPLGICALGYFIYVLIMRKFQSKQSYAKAQTQSSEAVSLIKTVKMLGAEKFQQELYNQCLSDYEQKIKSYPIKVGVSTALFFFIQYFILGVGFLLGIQCVRGTAACPVSVTGSTYSIGDLHSVLFSTYICTFYFLQLAANYDAIRSAIISSKSIDKFIKQAQQQAENSINKCSDIPDLINKVEFRNVSFAYSSNPNKQILKRTSFKLAQNKFNAVVGVTGSGKSTITNLILKLYSPSEGQVLIGDKDISLYNSDQLRERIGVVTQEPVLFSGTIRQNVIVGKSDATDEEVWQALREASISDFVRSKPQGLSFDVGFGGAKLSGGQKQRIAIARALIKKPQLLLLDQATSALDRKSEKVIQKTLQSIFLRSNLSMTVLCIAHKIKTIRKADKIMVLQNGIIKQEGRFEELNFFKDYQISPEQEAGMQQTNIEEQFQQIQANQLQANKDHGLLPDQQYKQNVYRKLLSYTENKCLYSLGIVLAFINGLNHPAATLIFSYAYTQQVQLIKYRQWTLPIYFRESVLDDYHDIATKFLAALIGFSFFVFIPYMLQFYIMTKIEDQITAKVRKEVFQKLMVMPAQWYEKPENEGGKVASRYGFDVKQISRLVSNFIPILITNITTIAGGVILCLVYLWEVGLLSLFCIPLIALGGYISINFISGYQDQSLHRYEQSDKVACQLMVNVKTAYSLNYQQRLLQKYKAMIDQDRSKILWRGAKIGFFFGSALLFIQASIGTTFYAADNILADIKVMDNMGITVSLIIPTWCGWLAGNNFFFAAHAAAGKKSAQNIFQLLEERTEKQTQQRGSSKIIRPLKDEIKGRIQFKSVSFKYSKSSKYVLKDVSFVIEAGQKAAFVGESGCGKSTLMLLMQRFYAYEGQITLDGENILSYDLEQYRKYLGVLSQQPSLFTGTVQSNIVFNSECSKEELYEACQMSFAYDVARSRKGQASTKDSIEEFIGRDAGSKGAKLSGGEKQRVACARAILKSPKIFLSDEGTSALDRETQRTVQRNIDSKFKGTTSVSVAHRMETIENADQIFMLQNGKIIEYGAYNYMMERKGYFFRFVNGTNQKQPTSYQNEFKQ